MDRESNLFCVSVIFDDQSFELFRSESCVWANRYFVAFTKNPPLVSHSFSLDYIRVSLSIYLSSYLLRAFTFALVLPLLFS